MEEDSAAFFEGAAGFDGLAAVFDDFAAPVFTGAFAGAGVFFVVFSVLLLAVVFEADFACLFAAIVAARFARITFENRIDSILLIKPDFAEKTNS